VGAAVVVDPSDVIAISQREVSFWNQLAGSISYGFRRLHWQYSYGAKVGSDGQSCGGRLADP